MSGVMEQVPEGYKQSVIGFIPVDWEVKELGDLISRVEYGSSAKSNGSGTVPVLRMGNLQSGKIDWENLVYTSDEEEINKYLLHKNDVLFNRTNTIDLVGKTSIYKGERPAIFAGYLIRIHRAEALLDPDYLNYILNSYHSKKYSKFILSVAVSQANINGQKLKTYPIPTPPRIKEQTAIAKALSDVDALITSLEKLIAKKRAIKTAAMQQLLTGKKRLPPFDKLTSKEKTSGKKTGYKQTELGEIPEDWECIDAKEAINFFGGFGFSSNLASSSGIKWLKISNVGLHKIKWDAESFLPERLKAEFKEYLLNAGDIVMALTRPILSDKLKVARMDAEDTPALLNQRVARLESKSFHQIKFLYYVVQRLDFVVAMNLSMAGTDPPNIGTVALGKIKIVVPSKREEQNSIATALGDIETEIERVEKRLNKTQQLKQGMMQELLTGKTRLI